ncbi:hypothetical protein M0805_006844 [Coniferiporia weirii]|nr:hypothetical protein M0805_006844 [Coniferiporia weirii]
MSLRRFAQSNASTTTGSPVRRVLADMGSNTPPRSPLASSPNGHGSPGLPTTPGGTKIVYPISPMNSESLSATRRFDWEAVRLRKPPPYASPLQGARVKAQRKSEAGLKNVPKRAVRKKSWHERITAIPNRIMFEISVFPNNVPLPESKMSAWMIGGLMHATNLFVRIAQNRQVTEEELPWADLYSESRGSSWFDWTVPLTCVLILSSFFNAFRLFSRVKVYSLHHRPDLVNSPRASFVSTQLDLSPAEAPSTFYRVFSWLAHQFSVSWRFLFNFKPPAPRVIEGARFERVQQLNVWLPGELELHLFTVFSPAHAFLWMGTTGANWIVMFTIMAIVGLQTHLLMSSYEGLLKDKAIIAAEVMHEYDNNFVNPRLNSVREDKAVMTHQAEVVDIWND